MNKASRYSDTYFEQPSLDPRVGPDARGACRLSPHGLVRFTVMTLRDIHNIDNPAPGAKRCYERADIRGSSHDAQMLAFAALAGMGIGGSGASASNERRRNR